MFRLLRDALASPTAPAPPQPQRPSTTASKAGSGGQGVDASHGEAIIDQDVAEMKKDAKDGDWEVKKVIQSIKLWLEEGGKQDARDTQALHHVSLGFD